MHPSKGLFITGTDTGIGKTYVAKILIDGMRDIRTTTYMKAVQTGCVLNASGFLEAPDFRYVMSGSTTLNAPYEYHVPYRFKPECSPHLAAALTNTVISLDHIRECYQSISADTDLVIIEGAGGILAPLSDTTFMIDLIVHLQSPAVVVTTPRLGTLNHTFMTLRLLRESGVPIAGVVMNCPDRNATPAFIHEDNTRTIRSHIHPLPFLELPYDTLDTTAIKEFCNALANQL